MRTRPYRRPVERRLPPLPPWPTVSQTQALVGRMAGDAETGTKCTMRLCLLPGRDWTKGADPWNNAWKPVESDES